MASDERTEPGAESKAEAVVSKRVSEGHSSYADYDSTALSYARLVLDDGSLSDCGCGLLLHGVLYKHHTIQNTIL